jgi:hypothetical protein
MSASNNAEALERAEKAEAECNRLEMCIEVIHGAALGDRGQVAEQYRTEALTAVNGLVRELAVLREQLRVRNVNSEPPEIEQRVLVWTGCEWGIAAIEQDDEGLYWDDEWLDGDLWLPLPPEPPTEEAAR